MATSSVTWPTVIIHFMNYTEHMSNASTYGHLYLREFAHVPYVKLGAPVYLTGQREPCYFNYNYLNFDDQSRSSYQKFHQGHSVLIFIGKLNSIELEKLVRFCYPWVVLLCGSKARGDLSCCDAFYEARPHDLIRGSDLRTLPSMFNRGPVVKLGGWQACGRCGTYNGRRALLDNPFEITSKGSTMHCRVPPNQWVFKPHTDHSIAFHDIPSERYLPYGNRLLKVLSEVFNFSFRFETGRQTLYGLYFLLDDQNRTESIWDGALNSLNLRKSLLALGSTTLTDSRDQFFSSSIVFSASTVVLVHKATRSVFSRCAINDSFLMAPAGYIYMVIVAVSALFVRLLDRKFSFLGTFATLAVMPVIPTIQTMPRRRSSIIGACRLATLVISLHISVHILDNLLRPHFDNLYSTVGQAYDHLRRNPQGRVWGQETYISGVVAGLRRMEGNREPMSNNDLLLYDMLTKKPKYFGELPKSHKLTVYAGKNPDNFIVDDQASINYFNERTDKESFINTIANLNSIYETILFQRGCTYERNFSRILRRLAESGHVAYWQQASLGPHAFEATIESNALSLLSFEGLFQHIIFQLVLILGSFLLEFLAHECVIEWHQRYRVVIQP